MRAALIAATIALAGCGGGPDTMYLQDVNAIDGDTFASNIGPVRLARIDTPEYRCRKGRKCVAGDPLLSHIALDTILSGGRVYCQSMGKDYYGRTLAECWVNGRNVSDLMLASGYAQKYQRRTE